MTGGAVSIDDVSTTGAVSVTGATIATTGTSIQYRWAGSVTLTGPVTLGANLTIDTDTNAVQVQQVLVCITSTVNGAALCRSTQPVRQQVAYR